MENKLPGNYQNQLGSSLTIDNFDVKTNSFTGTYRTAVGAPNHNDIFTVQGKFVKHKNDQNKLLLGFTVAWETQQNNYGSITTWTGILDNDVIKTTWLLLRSTDDHWDSTCLNQDVFRKQQQQKPQQQ